MSDTAKATGSPGPQIQLTPARLGLVLVFGILLTLLEIDALEFAYEKLRVPHRYFMSLLLVSFFGSMLNLPLFRLPGTASGGESTHTIVAVNLGGALVPTALALWVLSQSSNPGAALVTSALVAGVSYASARPIKGVGIAMPMLIPPLAAAGTALLLAPAAAAGVAYVGGTLGALIGADLLHFAKIRALGAPLVSVGGAGTFDGIFLSGLIAVLLAVL